MRMYQTVEFLINGNCGDFSFSAGEIYEMVLVIGDGAYWVLMIFDEQLYFKKDEINDAVKFLNGVVV